MTARVSSIYSLRVPAAYPQHDLDALVAGLASTGTELQDSHVRIEDGHPYAAVGFRAADDTEAARIAINTLDWAEVPSAPAVLITGYGAHRREVEW